MKNPRISIVVAADENRGIGKSELGVGKLLWNIPEDLKRFKELTSGHPVIMGRKTFESILSYRGKPLPDRTNIVITRNPKSLEAEFFSRFTRQEFTSDFKKLTSSLIFCSSIEEALQQAKNIPGSEETFVIGGGQIYEQAIGRTDRIYLTLIEGKFDADTFFPDYSEFRRVVEEGDWQESAEGPRYRYITLER